MEVYMQEFKNVWYKAVENLEGQITATAFDLWIKSIQPVKYESDCAVLLVESQFQKDVVTAKYKEIIKKALSEVAGFEMDISLITSAEMKNNRIKPIETSETVAEIEESITPIYNEYTFDNFVVGDSNKHAYAACLAVAKNPAKAYNPLFIYGNTGLGKTHLLYAIKNESQKLFPKSKILYIKSEDFVNELVELTQKGRAPLGDQKKTMTDFKKKYRSVDILLVDDIQFIAGKELSQIEFFHTFDALYENNKQIILSSDRPPRDIAYLDARLRARFEQGITADIVMPEYELKVAIIKQKASQFNIKISEDVIAFIAQRIKHNIRQIEGVLKKLKAIQLISDSPPNIAIAEIAIKDITTENEPEPVVVDKVLTEVSREFEVSVDDIKSKKQSANITFARQIAMYIIREITDMSLERIGEEFNRDHATTHHSVKKIETKIENSIFLKSKIDDIIKNIRNY